MNSSIAQAMHTICIPSISTYFNTLRYASLPFFICIPVIVTADCYCSIVCLITFLLWKLSFYPSWFWADSCCSVGIPLAGDECCYLMIVSLPAVALPLSLLHLVLWLTPDCYVPIATWYCFTIALAIQWPFNIVLTLVILSLVQIKLFAWSFLYPRCYLPFPIQYCSCSEVSAITVGCYWCPITIMNCTGFATEVSDLIQKVFGGLGRKVRPRVAWCSVGHVWDGVGGYPSVAVSLKTTRNVRTSRGKPPILVHITIGRWNTWIL